MITKTRKTNSGNTKGEPKHFTPEQIEKRLVAVLSPALLAKSGVVFTFAQWTLPGHGIVLKLSSGQEFWLPISEAGY